VPNLSYKLNECVALGFFHQCHHRLCERLEVHSIKMDQWWWWSDGCRGHFESADTFADCALYPDLFGVILHRFFFTSGHGKGEHDGTASVLKRQLSDHQMSDAGRLNPLTTGKKYCTASPSEPLSKSSTWTSRSNAVHLSGRFSECIGKARPVLCSYCYPRLLPYLPRLSLEFRGNPGMESWLQPLFNRVDACAVQR